jgi:pyruvate/2-oxoglutarate dehydrogenase complex dihydrolipoamide dehydrogenase (E3) component
LLRKAHLQAVTIDWKFGGRDSHALDVTAADGKASQVKAKNIFIATGSDARMLPGITPDDCETCGNRWDMLMRTSG